jgi:hypothetical protein
MEPLLGMLPVIASHKALSVNVWKQLATHSYLFVILTMTRS